MARKQVEAGAPATPAEPQATSLASWRDPAPRPIVLFDRIDLAEGEGPVQVADDLTFPAYVRHWPVRGATAAERHEVEDLCAAAMERAGRRPQKNAVRRLLEDFWIKAESHGVERLAPVAAIGALGDEIVHQQPGTDDSHALERGDSRRQVGGLAQRDGAGLDNQAQGHQRAVGAVGIVFDDGQLLFLLGNDGLEARDGESLLLEQFSDVGQVQRRASYESPGKALPVEEVRARIAGGRYSVLTPTQVAAIFERWGVPPVITEDLTGAAPPTMAQDRIDEIRAVAERPQPYPYPGAKPAGLYSQEPFPPLPELLVRFERQRLISPAYPWWARGFRALIVRYGETPVILIACCMIVAFFFGRTVWSLTYGPAA